jgi:predicted enzyme related to lactoylglutathione lyase
MAVKRGGKKIKKAAKAAKKSATRAPRAARKPEAPKVLPVVHWEIRAREPLLQQNFYRSLFDWTVDANNPMKYGMVKSSGGKAGSIDGGIGGTPNGDTLVTFYVQVDDIDAYLAKVEQLGGKTLMPRSDIGPVIMATFQDPEGNEIGLLEG